MKKKLSTIRSLYTNFDEFKSYSEKYGVCKMLGFSSPKLAWKKNPVIIIDDKKAPVAQ